MMRTDVGEAEGGKKKITAAHHEHKLVTACVYKKR